MSLKAEVLKKLEREFPDSKVREEGDTAKFNVPVLSGSQLAELVFLRAAYPAVDLEVKRSGTGIVVIVHGLNSLE